jgi:hypothetical protein
VITVTTSGQEIRVIVYLILQFSQFLNVFICSVPIACTTNIYKANTAVNQTNDTNEIFSQNGDCDSKKQTFMQKIEHNTGFHKKSPFLKKIGDNRHDNGHEE